MAVDQEMQLRLAITAQLVDIDEITKEMNNELNSVQKVARGMGAAANAAMVSAGAGLGVVATGAIIGVKALVAFEDAFAGVRKTVDADSDTLEFLSQQIRDLATQIPIAATELARIGELGGQLGIGAENLDSFIETVSKLGVATVLSTENAALALARLAAIANVPEEAMGDFFERTASALVDLGNNFAATEDEIVTTVLRIATAAEQTGASTQDALAFATALQAIGVPAQAGGTAISRVFQEIERAIQNGGEQLDLFAKVAGTTAVDFANAFGQDSAMAVASFIEGLSDADERGIRVQDTLKKLNLSQRRTQLAINGLAASGDLLAEALDTSRRAFDANIALQVEAAKKFTTTAQQIALLRNQFKEMTMTMGEEFMPIVRQVIFFMQGLVRSVSIEGVDAFTRLMKQILALGVAMKAFSHILMMVGKALVLVEGRVTALALKTAALQVLLNPLNIAKVAAGFAAVAVGIGLVKRAFDGIGDVGAGFQLADVAINADAFGASTQEAMEVLIKRKADFEAELTQFTNNNVDLTPAQQKNVDNLRNKIQGVNEDIEALEQSTSFIFSQELEKLTGSGGALGRIFTELQAQSSAGNQEATKVLQNIILGGADPELAIKGFYDKNIIPEIRAGEKRISEIREQLREEGGTSAHYNVELNQQLQMEISNVAKLQRLYDDLTQAQESLTISTEESAKSAAEKVLTIQGEKDINETNVGLMALQIQEERKMAEFKMMELGFDKEMLSTMELSGTVRRANLELERKQAELNKSEAERTLFELTKREIAIENVQKQAKKSSEAIVSLFQDIPEQVNMTALEVTRNLQDQAILGAEFMKTIQQLNEAGFVALAGMLAKEGPKALAVAQDFLASPIAAQEAEKRIAEANVSFIQELVGIADELEASDPEIRDAFFGTGENLVDGMADGIRAGDDAIRQALIDTINSGIEGLEVKFEISSPSMFMYRHIGVPLIDGVIAGIRSKKEEVEKAMEETVMPSSNSFNFSNMSPGDFFTRESQLRGILKAAEKGFADTLKVDFSSDAYRAGLAETKDQLADTFTTYTSFITTLQSVATETLSVSQAERDLIQIRKNGERLTKRLADANRDLADAIEKYGDVGVQTDFERLGIMREQLGLLNMRSQLNKKDTASERLALKDAKREVDFLEQAVKRGVASEDELQAAKERLAEMQGTTAGIENFQDRDAFEARLKLQKNILELEIKFQDQLVKRLETLSREQSDEILDAQDTVAATQGEIADQAAKEQIAQDKITQEKLAGYETQLKLLELADKLVALGPEGEAQFKKIAGAVGMPEAEISGLIEQAKEMSTQYSQTFDGIAKGIFDTKFIAKEMPILQADNTKFKEQIQEAKEELNSLYAGVGQKIPFPEIVEEVVKSIPTPVEKERPPMLHRGGFAPIGTSAIVGEFAPEMIKITPNGTMVKPLFPNFAPRESGGGMTIVEHLSVNVTGVPSDPQSARKAAQSIRKALVNLEKEGSSSSVLGR